MNLKRVIEELKALFYSLFSPRKYKVSLRYLAQFINESMNDYTILSLSKQFKGTDDEKIIKILKFVNKNIKYRSDREVHKVPEYWQTAIDTWKRKTGDCEDGAILILSLARLSGISKDKVYLSIGYVNFLWEKIGHAWVSYIKETDKKYIIDWNYNYSNKSISNRKQYVEKYREDIHGNDKGFYK